MGLKVKRFASTALSGRPAEVEKMKQEVLPVLPAPQKESAEQEGFADILSQVFPVRALWVVTGVCFGAL
jgi:hypothetical protein